MTDSKALAPVRNEIAVGDRGLELRSIDDVYRFAKYVVAAKMAPPGVETPEQALVAIQIGAELGFSPMRSLSVVHVIKGTPTLSASAMIALIMNSDLCIEGPRTEIEDEGKATMRAVCKSTRVGIGPVSTDFSIADAKAAGLWEGKTRNGEPTNWSKFPKDMLKARAQSRHGRTYYPDVILGMYTSDEIDPAGEARRVEVNVTPPRVLQPAADPLLEDSPAAPIPQGEQGAEGREADASAPATEEAATTSPESAASSDILDEKGKCPDCERHVATFGHSSSCPRNEGP